MNGLFEVLASMDPLAQLFLAAGVIGGFCSGISALFERRGTRAKARADAAEHANQVYRDFQVVVNGDKNVVQIGGDGMVQRARRVEAGKPTRPAKVATPAPLPAAPDDDDYCSGCQRTRGSWSMAWDEDGDDYRCRECRGLPEHTTLQERLEQVTTAMNVDTESAAASIPIIASVPGPTLYATVVDARAAVRAAGGGSIRTVKGKLGRAVGYTVDPAPVLWLPDRHDTPLELAQQRWLARKASSEASNLVLPPRGPYPETEADIDNQQRCTCPQCAQNRPPAIRRVFDNHGRQTDVLPGSLVDQVLWPSEPTLSELRMHAERWEAEGL